MSACPRRPAHERDADEGPRLVPVEEYPQAEAGGNDNDSAYDFNRPFTAPRIYRPARLPAPAFPQNARNGRADAPGETPPVIVGHIPKDAILKPFAHGAGAASAASAAAGLAGGYGGGAQGWRRWLPFAGASRGTENIVAGTAVLELRRPPPTPQPQPPLAFVSASTSASSSASRGRDAGQALLFADAPILAFEALPADGPAPAHASASAHDAPGRLSAATPSGVAAPEEKPRARRRRKNSGGGKPPPFLPRRTAAGVLRRTRWRKIWFAFLALAGLAGIGYALFGTAMRAAVGRVAPTPPEKTELRLMADAGSPLPASAPAAPTPRAPRPIVDGAGNAPAWRADLPVARNGFSPPPRGVPGVPVRYLSLRPFVRLTREPEPAGPAAASSAELARAARDETFARHATPADGERRRGMNPPEPHTLEQWRAASDEKLRPARVQAEPAPVGRVDATLPALEKNMAATKAAASTATSIPTAATTATEATTPMSTSTSTPTPTATMAMALSESVANTVPDMPLPSPSALRLEPPALPLPAPLALPAPPERLYSADLSARPSDGYGDLARTTESAAPSPSSPVPDGIAAMVPARPDTASPPAAPAATVSSAASPASVTPAAPAASSAPAVAKASVDSPVLTGKDDAAATVTTTATIMTVPGTGARTPSAAKNESRPSAAARLRDRPITGEIPGAYLVILPAEGFAGLCLDGEYIREYRSIGLPRHLDGDKKSGDDGRVPYGNYRIGYRTVDDGVAMLFLNWPNAKDAKQALADGRLGEADARRVADALRRNTLPPQDTPLGGGVGLIDHGEHPSETDGSFGFRSTDLAEIYKALPANARVAIRR